MYACHTLVFCDASRSACHHRAVLRLTCTSCHHSSFVNDHPCRSNAWTWLRITRRPALKRITDDVDPTSSFDELGLVQMPILAMVSAIEPFVFATTAMLELSGPVVHCSKLDTDAFMHQFSVQWSYPTICLSTLHHFASVAHAHRSQQPSMMRMPTPLTWDVQACVLSASLRVCSDAPVHTQSPRVRYTSHWP